MNAGWSAFALHFALMFQEAVVDRTQFTAILCLIYGISALSVRGLGSTFFGMGVPGKDGAHVDMVWKKDSHTLIIAFEVRSPDWPSAQLDVMMQMARSTICVSSFLSAISKGATW
jgi:hypothetical protein